jgi:hypothetical protein
MSEQYNNSDKSKINNEGFLSESETNLHFLKIESQKPNVEDLNIFESIKQSIGKEFIPNTNDEFIKCFRFAKDNEDLILYLTYYSRPNSVSDIYSPRIGVRDFLEDYGIDIGNLQSKK